MQIFFKIFVNNFKTRPYGFVGRSCDNEIYFLLGVFYERIIYCVLRILRLKFL
jgi:hypothetical protein